MYVLIYNGGSTLKIMREYSGGFSLYIKYLLNSPIKKHLSRQCIEKLWIMNRPEILSRTSEEPIEGPGNVVYYIY